MGELEELTYLKTVGDLRQHIGQVLHFSYPHYDKKIVAYMKKLTRVPTETYGGVKVKDTDPIPNGFMTYGTHLVILSSQNKYMKTPCVRYMNEENMSNAFDHIRIPTKEEMNLYNNLMRHARIFGLQTAWTFLGNYIPVASK